MPTWWYIALVLFIALVVVYVMLKRQGKI